MYAVSYPSSNYIINKIVDMLTSFREQFLSIYRHLRLEI